MSIADIAIDSRYSERGW